MRLKEEIMTKLKEAFAAVLPIALIVLILCATLVDPPDHYLTLFFVGIFILIIGMMLFTLGADISMMTIGEAIGSHLTKSRNLKFIMFICFILGVIVTIAEPDLRVLADTAPIVDTKVLIVAIAVGVGLFLTLSFLRVYLQIRLASILLLMYLIIFVLALSPLIPNHFSAIAFDSGGVTTGPITVPFIMALGVGLASVRGDKTSEEDSFGLVALCSLGPILTVLILAIISNTSSVASSHFVIAHYENKHQILTAYTQAFFIYCKEVAIAILPVLIFFLIFQFTTLKLDHRTLIKIIIGMIYTYLGLVLFLTGVNVGLMTIGYFIGYQIAESHFPWLLIPLGGLIGYFIVAAEPAVHVLKKQVEDITDGRIKGKAMAYSLAIGVAISVALSMLRVITGLSIWYILVPGYIFSLIMTFFVPPLFTAIAFDSGGVASGPMTATFLLPMAIGACEAMGGNILTDAFGIVAFVAMTPLVTIQMLGLINKLKTIKTLSYAAYLSSIVLSDELIDYDIEEANE